MIISGVLCKENSFSYPSATRSKHHAQLVCIVLASVLQACASDKANNDSAQGGGAGVEATSTKICAAGPPLIDDFADKDGFLNRPRTGSWGAFNDRSESGIQAPIDGTRGADFPASDDGTGNFALHTSGGGFKTWALVDAVFDCPDGYDASSFTGIQFRIKGKVAGGTTRLGVPTPQTTEIQFGGTCASNCNDHFGATIQYEPDWRTVVFHWADLKQDGWGTPATFDVGRLGSFEWNFTTVTGSPLSFDIWVDDLSFTVD